MSVELIINWRKVAEMSEKSKMVVVIAGSGKLVTSLLKNKELQLKYFFQKWDTFDKKQKAVVLHAGSGRQLDEIKQYCSSHQALLIQLSTGQGITGYNNSFPLIVCPNISLLIVKFMFMLEKFGEHFKNYEIQLIESHQSEKKSIPGTALFFSDSLNLDHEKIISVREKKVQQEVLNIPDEFMNSHAYHKIQIKDNDAELVFETKVYGHESYVKGVEKLLNVISEKKFDNKMYNITDLIALKYL